MIAEKAMAFCGVWLGACVVVQVCAENANLTEALGTMISLVIVALLTTAFSRKMTDGKPWQVIGVRVAGSWLLAISLLIGALRA